MQASRPVAALLGAAAVVVALTVPSAQAAPVPSPPSTEAVLDVVRDAVRERDATRPDPSARSGPSGDGVSSRAVDVSPVGEGGAPAVRRLVLDAPIRGLVASSDGTILYVLPAESAEVLAIDTTDAAIRSRIPLSGPPTAADLSIDGRTLYVLVGTSLVDEVDLDTGRVERTVDVGEAVQRAATDVVEVAPGTVAVGGRYLAVYDTPLLLPQVRRVAGGTELFATDLLVDRSRGRLFVFASGQLVVRIDANDEQFPVAATSASFSSGTRGALSGDGGRLRAAGGQDLHPETLAVYAEHGAASPYTLPGDDIGTLGNLGEARVGTGDPRIERWRGPRRIEEWPMTGCNSNGQRPGLHPTPLRDHTAVAAVVGTTVCIIDVPVGVAHVEVEVSRQINETGPSDVCVDVLRSPVNGDDLVHARLVGSVTDGVGIVGGWVQDTDRNVVVRVWDCGPGTTDFTWLAKDVIDDNGVVRQQTTDGSRAQPFDLSARRSILRKAQLARATIIGGVVRDAATGAPLAGVEVSAVGPGGIPTPRFGLTDEDGVHAFAGLPRDAELTFRFHDPRGRVPDEWFFDRAEAHRSDRLLFGDSDDVVLGLNAAMGSVGTERFAGGDRYQTAARFSQALVAPGARVTYLTTGANFPDALAGTPAAARAGASIVLTTPDALHPDAAAELARQAPAEVVVLGGPGAVSEAVLDAVRPLTRTGTVRRVAGGDRYETAAAVVRESFFGSTPLVFVATGEAFPDALAAGAVAGAADAPLLLVGRSALPAATAAELERLRPGTVVVAGGPTAIGDGVLAEIERRTGADVVRVAGGTRYDTAAMLAEVFPPGAPAVFLATGRNYPDALAAGPGAALTPGPLLLTEPDALPSATSAALQRLAPDQVVVLGGATVVGGSVEDEARRFVVR